MGDDLKRRRPEDPNKINVNQSWEVDYWTTKFGVDEATLKKAVSVVGQVAIDVEKWLKIAKLAGKSF